MGESTALVAERAARDTAQRTSAVSPRPVPTLAPHIISTVDMLQSVGPGLPIAPIAPIAPLTTHAVKSSTVTRRPLSGGAIPTQAHGLQVHSAHLRAKPPHAVGRDSAQLLFQGRRGSAPPGGRRTPSRGTVPRFADMHSPDLAPSERATREGRRPRSAMSITLPSAFSQSQPQLPRAQKCGFAQPAPLPSGLTAGAGNELSPWDGRRASGFEELVVRKVHADSRVP